MKNNKNKGLRRALVSVCIALGILLTVLLGLTIYAEYLLSKVNYVDPEATAPTLSQEQIEAVEKETEEIDVEFTGPTGNAEEVEKELEQATTPEITVDGEQVVNILLIGADYQSGSVARSDCMILCTFNKHTNTITLTSFLRDMYVKIPGYKSNRINASYFLGGMHLLNKTINRNFGVEADGIVEIDFTNFEKLIDMMGGIELDLTQKEAQHINKKSGRDLKPGKQVLDGEAALWYARFRKDSAGDFGRTNRQRTVLTILFNRYKELSLPELIGMLDDILPMVTTNMTKDEIVNYVTDLFPMLTTAEFVTQRIPVDGAYRDEKIDGMAVLVPNLSKNAKVLADLMYVPEETETEMPEGVG